MKKENIVTIYDNYDVFSLYEEDAKSYLTEEGNEDPTERQIADEVYFMDKCEWEDAKMLLMEFFDNGRIWIVCGSVERWNGTRDGGMLFTDFFNMLEKVGKDCEYFRFYDEDGHFYLQCSHHDGTNHFEIRRMTKGGMDLYNDWDYDFKDTRSEREMMTELFDRYSELPNFAKEMFG